MRSITGVVLALAVAAAFAACDSGSDDGISVDAIGAVAGLVGLDLDGNGSLEGTDARAQNVSVELVPWAGGEPAYSAEATAAGEFVIEDVLVGDYRLRVDEATVADSLRVVKIDPEELTVEANAVSGVVVTLSYPALTIDSARSAAPDTRVFVEGLVLTRWGTFGETSLHVRDSTSAIQAVRVPATAVVPGDSVRLRGTISVQTGQPVLKDAVLYLLKTGIESPAPDTLTTQNAATAGDGAYDADLVRVENALVTDSTRNADGEIVATVDDGSGPVDVVFDRDIPFFLQFPDGVVGSTVDVTGVLVPAAPGGAWVLKPRASADVTVQ